MKIVEKLKKKNETNENLSYMEMTHTNMLMWYLYVTVGEEVQPLDYIQWAKTFYLGYWDWGEAHPLEELMMV